MHSFTDLQKRRTARIPKSCIHYPFSAVYTSAVRQLHAVTLPRVIYGFARSFLCGKAAPFRLFADQQKVPAQP